MARSSQCPKCHQAAPIVLRGVEAFCTVCGARRTPFATSIINFAGRPERFGGSVARAAGWTTLVLGLFIALSVGLVVQAVASMLVAGAWLGWAIGVPLSLLAIGLGLFGILGGRRLGRAGSAKLAGVQLDTIRAIGKHRNGVVKPAEVSRALGISKDRADAMLAELAKDPTENVGIDVDENDDIVYLFGSADAIRWRIRAEAAGIDPAERAALEAELERAEVARETT